MNTKLQQTRFNDETCDSWESYASHRTKIAAFAIAAAKDVSSQNRRPSCCILGAGNGNDLDLAEIGSHFSAIHLFDIDQSALDRIKQRYQNQPDVLSRLVFEDPVDVSSVFGDLDNIARRDKPTREGDAPAEPTGAQHIPESLIKSARSVSLAGTSLCDRKFDIVISVCLLSQLIFSVVDTFGTQEKALPLLLAVRDGHLNLLVRLTNRPGHSILISDFVSSDTLPQLADANDDEKLLAAARKAIDERNFFTGTNPWAIIDKLRPQLPADDRDSLQVSPPWRWQLGPRFYAVTAITFVLRAS